MIIFIISLILISSTKKGEHFIYFSLNVKTKGIKIENLLQRMTSKHKKRKLNIKIRC